MSTDWPPVRHGVTIWTLLAALILGGVIYSLGAKQITYGLGFGIILALVNFKVIGAILEVLLRFTSRRTAKIISFLGYNVRFWLIVLLLYIVIPKHSYLFAIGTFIGFLIPKIVMGIFLVTDDNVWWSQEKLLESANLTTTAEEPGKAEELPGPDI